MQAELDQVSGGGAVTWDMRARLPYTMATLREIMRLADIAPTGLVHKTVCDVSLGGFSLEQDTLVMANHSACHKVSHHERTMFVSLRTSRIPSCGVILTSSGPSTS